MNKPPVSENISDWLPDDWWEKTIELGRNDFLVRKGRIDQYLYLVTEGAVRIFFDSGDEELTIRFGYKQSYITALDSYMNGLPTAFNIQALKKTTIKAVHRKEVDRFVQQNDLHRQVWQQMLEQLILQQLEREVDILTASPLERYQRVLERSPILFQEIPSKYIASYLRMTPETLSRLKSIK